MREGDVRTEQARRAFVASWAAVLLLKLVLATQLPLFVDEAFYWQEGQHPGWAYSDLPGLTAWLIRLGVELAGNSEFGVRLPFLMIAAALPWLMVRLVAREFGERRAWLAGCATVLLPLAGTLGLLALPDVPMALATLLCIDAGARLLRKVEYDATLLLALGLAVGALSHYRFIAVIGVGIVALLWLPEGRRALRDPRVWIAIAFGAAAWAPLLAWNLDNAEAGLRFQLVDRHPWSFHPEGLLFLPTQLALVTPLLFVALAWAAWRSRRDGHPSARLFALLGGLVVLGFFALGFFADTERVSFHWPLPGYLALLPLLPALLDAWPRWLRRATWALAAAGLAAIFGYYLAVSIPSLRAQSAALKWYPSNFAGWGVLADAVEEMRAEMPADTRIVADNFKIGAELGFALGDPRIAVLDHPLNRAHGRAPQLRLWGLQTRGRADWGDAPVLLVVGASDVPYRQLLRRYHALCERAGPLPPPRVLNIDHGAQRFLLFALDGAGGGGERPCSTPALAWIDAPAAGAAVQRPFEVQGWAFKDGTGLDRVEVTLDGAVVAEAEYGLPAPGVAGYWEISNDPEHPNVGFRATVDAAAPVRPGRYWLGLRLHGRDGSVEQWREQPVTIR
ncbi:glycosyltransferase family 39 protein [Luteimonas sp. R10]|uniref:glycosyltransferase family 39 protein n=1 Tax=Luteimonas sp. R10 TaxID=3108176 RepID=UPI00308EF3B1|nr:glycosyltransferase family 39 protein [Luteimonas sp. R10]